MRLLPAMALAFLCVGPARSQTPPPEADPAPYRLEIAYTVDAMANVRGGIRSGTVLLDNLDLTLTVDLERALGLDATSLFVYGLGNQGGELTSYLGDVQGADNIETVNAWRIYEAFLQRRLLSERLSILAGLYDINTEFDEIESAALFINSSFGIGPELALSREQGPSIFPFTSLGVRARALPGRGWYLQTALLDGIPGDPDNPRASPFHFGSNDGVLMVAEIGRAYGSADDPAASPSEREQWRRRRVSRVESISYRNKLAIGAWRYTARFGRNREPDRLQRGNSGIYVLAQRCLFSASDRRLSAFARAGLADSRVNQVGAYSGAGLVATGLLSSRPRDQLGVGVAIAHHSESYRDLRVRQGARVPARETAIEATYRAVATSWLSLQADLQAIISPGTDVDLPDAIVFGIRLQISN